LLLWLFNNNVDFVYIRDKAEIVRQLPFTTRYKYMATVVKTSEPNRNILYVKGAPEYMMKRSVEVLTTEGRKDIDTVRDEVDRLLLEYQSKALRTLGFAFKYITDEEVEHVFEGGKLQREDLCFLGITGIIDPIRDDVADSVQDCLNAGISIKIVTGDTPGTAREIGRQIGLWTESDDPERQLITGKEFNLLSDDELRGRIGDIKIMSRARPADKERLVRLLQEQGEVVAVTGDGTNDAPALNTAHIGLSMGDGTTVAKEASDITILDNSFKSIARAVTWGRSLYLNIQRFILFQMTINVAACLIVLIGAMLGTTSPLTVTQMLWINLIMDTFAALALASLPPNEKVMHDKPRRDGDSIITRKMMKFIGGAGLLFAVLMLGMFCYLLFVNHSPDEGRSLITSHIMPDEVAIYFTTFVFLQFWNMFNAKAFDSGHSAFHNIKDSKVFFSIAAIILVGQIVIVQVGYKMFQIEPLTLKQWLIIFFGTSPVMLIGEFIRYFKNKA